jgi:Polyketide cyclase / dehydrase and lipid transport
VFPTVRVLYGGGRFSHGGGVRVLKLLGVGAVVAVAAFIAVGLVMPSTWRVSRHTEIRAPARDVQARIVSLKGWPEWAAYSTRTDSAAVFSWEGRDGEVGSAMAWRGPKLGVGRVVLTKSIEGARVGFDAAIESDAVNAHSEFELSENAGVTKVTWSDEGKTPPIVGGFMVPLIEDALGAQFDTALARLKLLCEGGAS